MTLSISALPTFVRSEPLIWISRIVLYESVEPLKTIRPAIHLRPGLNVIWGTEAAETTPDSLDTGHNVGKTTFCRLMRYCLGEPSFANAATTLRIKYNCPKGYVAAEIHLDGEVWAVARPFVKSQRALARANCTIEGLLATPTDDARFPDFLGRLSTIALRGISAEVRLGSGEPIGWEHLLAWWARDQETRYQTFWTWRSSRSHSGFGDFKKPKRDPVQIVCAALHLLADDETKVQQDLTTVEEKIGEVQKDIAEKEREPLFRSRLCRDKLEKLQVDNALTGSLDDNDLLGVPRSSSRRLDALRTEFQEVSARFDAVSRQSKIAAAALQEPAQLHDERTAAAEIHTGGADDHLTDIQDKEKLGQTIREVVDAGGQCLYGDRLFKDCQYIQEHLVTLDAKLKKARSEKMPDVHRRQTEASDLHASADRQRPLLLQRRERLDQLTAEEEALRKKKQELTTAISDIEDYLQDLQKWSAVLRGEREHEKLGELTRKLADLEQKKKDLSGQLDALVKSRTGRATQLRTIFCGLVRRVLPGEYTGEVDFNEGVPEWKIRHQTELTGEAFETLSLLLADVACMVTGAAGHATHPGLLIHDSPREADLGDRIYHRYLQCVAALGPEAPPSASAPFQYVVTTTTPPPENLQNDGTTVLRLGGDHSLLFGQQLEMPKDRQYGLPGFGDQEPES